MADARKTLEIIISAKDEASKVLKGTSESIKTFSGNWKVGAAALSGIGAATAGLATAVVKQAGAFEQYKTALRTMIGDADRAEKHFEVLKDFAKATPFNFEEVVKNNNLLLAMGANVEDVTHEMTILGNAAAALHVPLERMALNFGQVRAQGKLTGREVRDFAVAGVDIIGELATQLNKTKAEISDMVSEGEIGFPEVLSAFEAMSAEGGRFHDLMQQQSLTTLGRFSNLQDSIQQTAAALGKALLPAVNKVFDAIIPLVTKFAEWASQHQRIVVVMVAVGLALGVIGSAALALSAIVAGLALVFSGVGLAIISIVGVIALLAIKWDEIILAVENFKTKLNELKSSVVGWVSAISISIKEMKDNIVESIGGIITEGLDRFRSITQLTAEEWGTFFGLMLNTFEHWKEVTERDMIIWESTFKASIASSVQEGISNIRLFVSSTVELFGVWKQNLASQISAAQELLRLFFIDKLNQYKEAAGQFTETIASYFRSKFGEVLEFVNKVKGAVESAINSFKKFGEGFSSARKSGLTFQHGGFVPGAPSQAVPAILHGGERVIPRTGVDVNGGGGGINVTLEFSGPISMDSTDRVSELAQTISDILNRQSELAQKGVGY